MPDDFTLHESFVERHGVRFLPQEIPFVWSDGRSKHIPCVHVDDTTGMIGNHFPDDRFRVVIAFRVKDQVTGMYQALSAEEARVLGNTLLNMADVVDKENGDA